MPFIINDVSFSETDVLSFEDLLTTVEKAVKFFEPNEEIKRLHAWLLQLPKSCPSFEEVAHSYESLENIEDMEDIENIEDTKSSQNLITEMLREECYEAFAINKRVWVLSKNGLLLLSQRTTIRQSTVVVVPMTHANFKADRLTACLYWLRKIFNFVYEIAPNVMVFMGSGRYESKVASIASSSPAPDFVELAKRFRQHKRCSIDLNDATTFVVHEDGRACVWDRIRGPKHLVYLV